jgi:hypothetical protein
LCTWCAWSTCSAALSLYPSQIKQVSAREIYVHLRYKFIIE